MCWFSRRIGSLEGAVLSRIQTLDSFPTCGKVGNSSNENVLTTVSTKSSNRIYFLFEKEK